MAAAVLLLLQGNLGKLVGLSNHCVLLYTYSLLVKYASSCDREWKDSNALKDPVKYA